MRIRGFEPAGEYRPGGLCVAGLPRPRMEMDPAHHHKDVYEHSLKVLEQAMEKETDEDGPCPARTLFCVCGVDARYR